MEATHRGGLAGKARNNRHRRRIERIHAQQMLEEYLGEEEDQLEMRSRHVPVRGRADFLPTIDSWSRDDETIQTGSQLELTLSPAPDRNGLEVCEESESMPAAAMSDVETINSPIVIPAPYWARPRASFQPQGGRGVARTFDLRRFAYGCALGGAAAAVILLVVGIVFH